MSVLEYGQIRANPRAAKGLVEIAKAESFEATPCKDSGSQALADTVTVSGIVWEGMTKHFPAPIDVEDTEAIREAIVEILQANGEREEFNVWIKVDYAGGELTVEHIGQTTISEVLTSATNVTLSRACTVVGLCQHEGQVVGAVSVLKSGTGEQALATGTYAYAGDATDATTAATLKADLETALTALSVNYKSVEVAVNDTEQAYEVRIVAEKDAELYLDSRFLSEVKCWVDFE